MRGEERMGEEHMEGRRESERGEGDTRNEVDEIYIFFLERLLMLPVCNLYYFSFFYYYIFFVF